MTFFAKVTAPSKATFETIEKKYEVWNKGLKGAYSEEHRAKISAGQKGRKRGPASAEARAKMSAARKGKPKGNWSAERRAQFSASMATPVMTPHGLFPSIRAISEASGCYPSTVRKWIKKFPEHYYYVAKGE